MTSTMGAGIESTTRSSHELPPWLRLERRREVAELRRTATLVELVCVVSVVVAFIWLLKDADLYAPELAGVWFAPVVIALYGAVKTGSVERRLALAEASIAADETAGSAESAARTGDRVVPRSRVGVARLAWVGFVALTVVLAAIGYRAVGDSGDDELEEDEAVVSGQRL